MLFLSTWLVLRLLASALCFVLFSTRLGLVLLDSELPFVFLLRRPVFVELNRSLPFVLFSSWLLFSLLNSWLPLLLFVSALCLLLFRRVLVLVWLQRWLVLPLLVRWPVVEPLMRALVFVFFAVRLTIALAVTRTPFSVFTMLETVFVVRPTCRVVAKLVKPMRLILLRLVIRNAICRLDRFSGVVWLSVLFVAELMLQAAPFMCTVGVLHTRCRVRRLVTTGARRQVPLVLIYAPLARLKHDTRSTR